MKRVLSAGAVVAVMVGAVVVATSGGSSVPATVPLSSLCVRNPRDGGTCRLSSGDGGVTDCPLRGYAKLHRARSGCELFECPRDP